MPKRKIPCVCSVIYPIAFYHGNHIEGEIFIKHSPQCRSKTTGSFEWTGVGYEPIKEKGGQE